MNRLRTFLIVLMLSAPFFPTQSVSAFSGGGSGTSGSPYIITDVGELQEMENDLGAYYLIANDIDASVTSTWNGGAGFDPIGNEGSQFTGSLDGYGFTISNLTINRPTEDKVGLIGLGWEETLSRINLKDCTIVGKDYVGTLEGEYDDGVDYALFRCRWKCYW